MFPFKVQLFQGCKSETEIINTKSVVQDIIRYQILLAAYYKAGKSIVGGSDIVSTKKYMNK
jgi:hypothetical protein